MLLWVQSFGSGLFSVWFGYVWQDLSCSISVTSRFYPLSFNICLSLISAAEGWNEGHAGFGPTCLLWGLPPLSTPRLPLTDFSHFCARCCFGNRSLARHMGASGGISESVWSGSAGILSYSTYRLFHTHLRYFYSSKLNSMSVITLSFYTELKPDNVCIYSSDSFTSAPGLLWNEVIPCQLIPFTTEIDSLQSSFGHCYATRDSSWLSVLYTWPVNALSNTVQPNLLDSTTLLNLTVFLEQVLFYYLCISVCLLL